uniref:Uncharacterized protein n=1 Tax=Anopheles coluzzii TaxID=1518534 RepID=A0A8W7PUX4_ANOCL
MQVKLDRAERFARAGKPPAGGHLLCTVAHDQVQDGRYPEGGHYPPGRAGKVFHPGRTEQAQLAIDGFVHPFGVLVAQPVDLKQHRFAPVHQVLDELEECVRFLDGVVDLPLLAKLFA